jgi:hypothetical protein
VDTARTGQHDRVHVERVAETTTIGGRSLPQAAGDRVEAIGQLVAEHDLVDAGGQQLASDAGADRARTDDPDPGAGAGGRHRSSDPESSRHPPDCGGVPPLPRSRSMAATIVAKPRATRARRSIFMWG